MAMSHSFMTVSLAAAAALVGGCATAPLPPPMPAPVPQVQSLAEMMGIAQRARDERMTNKERETYRVAARHYPTAKEPWSRLSESYFEASDYGNAILAAQEVLQRDAEDLVAASVLAVSGLRVSTQALSALRNPRGSLSVSTRKQAEELATKLRELLGETVLVPQPAEPPASAVATTPVRRAAVTRPLPRPAFTPKVVAPQPTVSTNAATPAAVKPVASPARKSPFDTLK